MTKNALLISVLLVIFKFCQFQYDKLPNLLYRRISLYGLEFLKKREGCKLKAYQDYKKVWTIG